MPLAYIQASASLVLDLKMALKRTAEDNKQLLMSLERVSQSDARRRKDLAPLLPQVKLKASQKRSRVDINFLPDNLENVVNNPVEEADYGAALELKLNPTLYATYKASQVAAKASKERHGATRQALLAQTAQLYFAHVRNQEKRKALDASQKRARSLLELAEIQAEAGLANDLDVIRARQRLKHEESRLAAHGADFATSLLNLRQQLSLPETLPVEVPTLRVPLELPETFQRLKQDQLTKARGEYRESEQLLEQARLAHKAASLQRLPTFSITGDWGYRKKRLFGSDEPANIWALGFQVSIPVFDGFAITSDKLLASSILIERRHGLQDLRLKISREQDEAYEQIQARVAQRISLEEAVELAQKELERAQVLFTEGVARHQDVVDAQDRLAQAEDQAIEAAHAHLLALVAFAQAQGRVQETLLGFLR